jgi:hypothetical protein
MEMQIPQLQDISYILATQRFILYFIHHITYHHLMPTKHMQTSTSVSEFVCYSLQLLANM